MAANFWSSLLEPTSETTPSPTVFDASKWTKVSKHKISPLKLSNNFVNEIKNDEENINNEI